MSFQDLEEEGRPSSLPSAGGGVQSSSQSIAGGIFQINTGVAGFRRLVDAIGTSKDTPDHRHKLHITRQRVLQLAKETSALLKSVTESDHIATTADPSKRIEYAKLAKDFTTALLEFQKLQQLASERESTYSPSLQPSSSDYNTASVGAEASIGQDKQPLLTEQKRQEVLLLENEIAFNDGIMEEREHGIVDIQYQIGEANEIFKDLAVLVYEQGVGIDDIQSHVDASSGATTQARVQLSKASKRGKSKCSWCWWVLGIVAVVMVTGLIILIIL